MEKLIYSIPIIKKTLLDMLNCKIVLYSNGELVEYSNNKKKYLKNYSKDEPLLMKNYKNKIYIIFENFIDIYNGQTLETRRITIENPTALNFHNDYLFLGHIDYIHEISLKSFKESKLYFENSTKINAIKNISDDVIVMGDSNGILSIFNTKSKSLKKQKLHGDAIQDIQLFDNYLFTASRDKIIKKVFIDKNEKIKVKRASNKLAHFINCISISDIFIYAGLSNGELVQLDTDLNILSKKHIHADSIRSVISNKDEIITIADDGVCNINKINEDNSHIIIYKKLGDKSSKIKCSCKFENQLLIGTSIGEVILFDLQTLERSVIYNTKDLRSIQSIGLDSLIVCLENGHVYYIELIDTQIKFVKNLNKGTTAYSINYCKENNNLFIGRRDGIIEKYVFDVNEKNFKLVVKKRIHNSIIGDVKSKDGFIYTCSDDQAIQIFDADLNWLNSIKPSESCTAINNIEFSKDDMIASSDDGYIYIIENNRKIEEFNGSSYPIRALCYIKDFYLISGDRNGGITIWDENMNSEIIYQGNSRVVNIYYTEFFVFIVFEYAVISIERGSIKMESNSRVFIIHGHNNELKREVQILLSRAGIDEIVLHEQPDEGRTIIDKLIEESSSCQFAIGILSQDDLTEGGIYRARQNVLLEIGYFLGKLGKKRVLMLKLGDIEIPSDLKGVLYTEVDNIESASWKTKVLRELKNVGYSVDFDRVMEKM